MSTVPMSTFLANMATIAAGSLAGKNQAQTENDQDAAQQAQENLRQQQFQLEQQRYTEQQRMAPYQAVAPYAGQLEPADRARYLQGMIAAAGQQPGQQPQNPGWPNAPGFMPTQPAQQTGVMPGQMPPHGLPATPPMAGGPPVPGAATGAPGVAPQGAPPANPLSFTGPSGMQLSLQGVTPQQRQQQGARLDRAAGGFKGHDLTPELRRQVDTGLAAARDALSRAQTPEEFRAATQQVDQVEGLLAQVPAAEGRQRATSYRQIGSNYTAKLNNFQKQRLSPAGAYAAIDNLYGLEQQAKSLADKDPTLAAGYDTLSTNYGPQIDQMRADRARELQLSRQKTRTPAEEQELGHVQRAWKGTATDIYNELHYGAAPQDVDRALTAARQWYVSVPPEQRKPENVAQFLDQNGAHGMAQLVRDQGLNIGGAEAERNTQQLLSRLPEMMKPGVPPQALQGYVNDLAAQSALTGHPISIDPKQLMDADPKALLEVEKLQRDKVAETEGGTKWQNANLDVDIKRAKLAQLTGQAADPALQRSLAIVNMRQYQRNSDTKFNLYKQYLHDNPLVDQSSFDPKTWVSTHKPGDYTGLDADVAKGVKLYVDWQNAVDLQKSAFDNAVREAKKAPVTGGAGNQNKGGANQKQTGTRTAARDQPRLVTIGGRQMRVTPAQAWETMQRSVQQGRLTPAQANANMRDLFGTQ